MSIIIQLVIGEFELIEGHDLFHPMGSFGWGIWMNVNPGWRVWISLSCHNPARTVCRRERKTINISTTKHHQQSRTFTHVCYCTMHVPLSCYFSSNNNFQ